MNFEKIYGTISVNIVPALLFVSEVNSFPRRHAHWRGDNCMQLSHKVRHKGGYGMEQREFFQFDYQLNKKELREMSFRMTLDSFFQYKPIIFLGIILLTAGIFLTFTDMALGGGLMCFIPNVFPTLIIFGIILLLTHSINYGHLIKFGMLNEGKLSLEDGYVKLEKGELFVSPASSYTKIIKGRTVLLLGQKLSNKTTSFVGIPRRAFVSAEELDSFVTALRHSKAQEDSALGEQEVNQRCDYVLTFEVTREQWLRIFDEIIRVLNSVSPGRRRIVITVFGVLIAATTAVTMYIKRFNPMEAIFVAIYLIVVLGVFIIFEHFRKSKNKYRKWMEKGLMPTEAIGQWEIGICQDGCYTFHNGTYSQLNWSEYCRCYETKDTVYFFKQNLKCYLFIPKISLGGEEGQERFFAYFHQLGMEFTKVDI